MKKSKEFYIVFLDQSSYSPALVGIEDGSLGNFLTILEDKRAEGEIFKDSEKAKLVYKSLEGMESPVKFKKITIQDME